MPNMKDINEHIDDLNEKITSKIYGVTDSLRALLNVDDDVKMSNAISIDNDSQRPNLSNLVIRKGRKSEDMTADFNKTMEALGQSYVHSIPLNDRIRLIREYNYMLSQMPQLYTTLSSLAHHIMSPDNYDNTPLQYNIYLGENSSLTEADIRASLEEKNVYKLIKDGIRDSLCLGYRYYEVQPLAEVAKKLLDRINTANKKNQNNGHIKQLNITTYTASHINIPENTDEDDITLYGESDVVIPGSFVRMYREAEGVERANNAKLILECVNDALGISNTNLYAENYKANPTQENLNELLASNFFTTSSFSIESRDELAYQLNNILMGESQTDAREFARNLYAEDDDSFKRALTSLKKASRKKSRTRVSNLNGCHVTPLDDEKVYPIILNKEEIGVYVVDTYQDIAFAKTVTTNINNVLGSNRFADQADFRDNPLIRRDIVNGLSSLISKHLDSNFVTDNRRTLAAIEELLDERDLYNMQFRIRWIPRKYLVPFHTQDNANGLGKSRLLYARIPIIYWIYLNQNKLMTKLFYEKDKLAIKYRTTFAQSLFNERADAMDIFTNLFPLPSELLDFSKVNATLGSIGRLLIPVDKNGNELFSVDRIEGQKYDTSQDDYMGELEKTIESLLGFPVSSLYNAESKYEYATSIIAQDGRLVTLITDQQVHYTPAASELATKIARYESGTDEVVVEVHFQEPKLLTKSISDEGLTKFLENMNNNMRLYYGDDEVNLPPDKKVFVQREFIKAVYPAYDNSELFEAIEKKWKVNKAVFNQDNNKDDEGNDDEY